MEKSMRIFLVGDYKTGTGPANVTKELLKKLNFHKITLRLWDTKDRVSKRARYQRVKASAYSEDLESLGKLVILLLF